MDEGLTPRAMTQAEMRHIFVETLRRDARYWATVQGRSVEDKLLGLGFSFLVMLDGATDGLPAFEIVPVPHESNEAYHRENGTNWWPAPFGATRKIVESFGIHGGTMLHDLFSARRREKAFLVWWTTQAEAEVISNEYGDGLVEGTPEYLQREWASRRGRPGRGRLWVSPELKDAPEELPVLGRTGITQYLDAGSAAGIVIRAEDAVHLRELPGLITTTAYERY